MEKTATHDMLSENYAALLKKAKAKQPCCGVPCTPQGYEEIDQHEEVAGTSFGCGNPLAFAGVQSGQTVLDLGSGAGLDLLIAAEIVGPAGKVIGVDMTQEMIETARENARKAGFNNIEVREGMIERLPLEDGSVDWVISNCVINLSPDKPRVFSELARVLKPGGRVSISDIVVEQMPDWLRDNRELYTACVAGAIPEADYIAGLQAAGLLDVEVSERHIYSCTEMLAIVESDLQNLGMEPAQLDELAAQMENQVWSAKFTARSPGS